MTNTTSITTPCPTGCGHAVCAWCRVTFGTVVELIEHADAGHAGGMPQAA